MLLSRVANLTSYPLIWTAFSFNLLLDLYFANFLCCVLIVFQMVWKFSYFNLLQNAFWACFIVNLLSSVLFIDLLVFVLFNFPVKRIFGLIFCYIASFGLLFRFTCFFTEKSGITTIRALQNSVA